MSSVQVACLNYQTEYNVFPSSTENDLLTKALIGKNPRGIEFIALQRKYLNMDGEIIDAYGTPLRITFPPDKNPLIVSAGKDRAFNTRDDIRSDK